MPALTLRLTRTHALERRLLRSRSAVLGSGWNKLRIVVGVTVQLFYARYFWFIQGAVAGIVGLDSLLTLFLPAFIGVHICTCICRSCLRS